MSVRTANPQGEPTVANARAVCDLRLALASFPVELLRPLVFRANGITVNPDAPVERRANFSVALLRVANFAALQSHRRQLQPQDHRIVRQLPDAGGPRPNFVV